MPKEHPKTFLSHEQTLEEVITVTGNRYSPDLRLMREVGCEICNGSGYKGRVAIHELFLSTKDIKKAIQQRATADELKSMAIQNGMRTLIMDGINKVFQGITDLEKILQVCRYESH